jgi:serine/threonine protein kinase
MISKKLVIQGEEFLIDGKHLGSGTQGSVFQILHLGSGIVYAVKIVNVQNKNALETMEHEINILKNIRSPYVISILPFSIVSERYSYMVMDYCEGGDLKEHYKRLMLGKIPVDEKRVKKLIHDCAQGYKAL